jgi:hypothetical protein
MVSFLLGKAVQVSPRDEEDVTPLMLACEWGRLEVVQMLVEATEGQGVEQGDWAGGHPCSMLLVRNNQLMLKATRKWWPSS